MGWSLQFPGHLTSLNHCGLYSVRNHISKTKEDKLRKTIQNWPWSLHVPIFMHIGTHMNIREEERKGTE